jgi:probable HAF family extracellular repeat protein
MHRYDRVHGTRRLLVASSLVLPTLSSTVAHATTYSVTKLAMIAAFGINKNGDVVGTATDSKGFEVAALVKGGTTTVIKLGHLFPPSSSGDIARAVAINSSQQAVGFETNPNTLTDDPGLWQHATATSLSPELGPIANFGIDQQATAINDSGTIVGFEAEQGSFPAKSWVLEGSNVTILPTLGGPNSEAFGINNAGAIVGLADVDAKSTTTHAYVLQNGSIKDLGALGTGQISGAFAINSSGVAVGFSTVVPGSLVDRHAAVFANGKVTDLSPTISGEDAFANAINIGDVIVGSFGNRAFIWENGVGTDLNTLLAAGSGVTVVAANGINDSGQIAAVATLTRNGAQVGVLLTPQ